MTNNFLIKENGIEINQYNLICPTIDFFCCLSASLVMDRGITMQEGNPSGIAASKAAAKAFIDAMDGVCDEATLVSFNSTVTVDEFMTIDKVQLQQGIDALSVGGSKAVWDAAVTGIQELVNNGTQECRGVILFSDGNDNASNNDINDVISLALANKIHVYTIGYGGVINDSVLHRIATQTGGKYYRTPQPAQLAQIYKELMTHVLTGFYECEITYNSKCMDGTYRNVELTLQRLFGCAGTDTKTNTFTAPKDTSTLAHIIIHPQNQNVQEGDTVTFIVDALRATHYQWMKDSIIIPGATNLSITITSVKKSDEGMYSALVSSDCNDTSTSTPARLNVIATSVDDGNTVPDQPILYQNYPNPFSQETAIGYRLSTLSNVRLEVFDLFGRKIATLIDEQEDAGIHKYNFNPNALNLKLSNGLFVCVLHAGKYTLMKQLVLMK